MRTSHLFANQDTLPQGGFGNLVALPLRKQARERGNTVFLDRSSEPHADQGLPPALRNRILRLAAFQNPESYRAQAMRLPTYDRPRVVACAEEHLHHIGLPRGCLDELPKQPAVDDRTPEVSGGPALGAGHESSATSHSAGSIAGSNTPSARAENRAAVAAMSSPYGPHRGWH